MRVNFLIGGVLVANIAALAIGIALVQRDRQLRSEALDYEYEILCKEWNR